MLLQAYSIYLSACIHRKSIYYWWPLNVTSNPSTISVVALWLEIMMSALEWIVPFPLAPLDRCTSVHFSPTPTDARQIHWPPRLLILTPTLSPMTPAILRNTHIEWPSNSNLSSDPINSCMKVGVVVYVYNDLIVIVYFAIL